MRPPILSDLASRSAAITGSPVLSRLAGRLRRLLDPLLEGPIYLPDAKALLSRDGGVCPQDGARLTFDPLSPNRHRCPRCGQTYDGERHHRAWILRYHIWLSERAIHLALLGSLHQEPALSRRSAEILDQYAIRYRGYPNQDNVLGPTRLFFSTYLESIWLAQIGIAATLLDASTPAAWSTGARTRLQSMVAESAELIGSFDESWSNRQVWNNAALVAAGSWLADEALTTRGLDGPHGIRAQLATAVSSDGLWFEGENYHFFALRGFLLGAEILRLAGVDLYREPGTASVLAGMYRAPFKTVLPDLTLPARSDSPFGVSLLQPRFAELWEIGRVRTGDEQIGDFLAGLYSAAAPESLDSGFAELAEQETNRPPERLSRERLSWKAVLWMLPESPESAAASKLDASILLAGNGLAVLRPAQARYASLECGRRTGGHGHPDLLHLTLFWDHACFVDPGTASYVSPSLHWYRSTLAHNAPGLAGVGQVNRDGYCSAFEAAERWSWVRATGPQLFGPETSATRSIIVGPDYVVDIVDVVAPESVQVDLPVHPVGGIQLPKTIQTAPAFIGSDREVGHEHGYDALRHVSQIISSPHRIDLQSNGAMFCLALPPRPGEQLYCAQAPGPPDWFMADGEPVPFMIRRASGTGRWVQLYASESGAIGSVTVSDREVVVSGDRGGVTLTTGEDAVVIAEHGGATIRLGGELPRPRTEAVRPAPLPPIACPLVGRPPELHTWEQDLPGDAIHDLGAADYRRAEIPYGGHNQPSARVAVFATASTVGFVADVTKAPDPVVIRPADAPDPALDNEAPDIHSDGLQCYVESDGWWGFVILPDQTSGAIRVRGVRGTSGDPSRVRGTWMATPRGYRVLVLIDVGRRLARGDRFAVNLVINQMLPGRERRSGQLVLSGDRGWVYLRGDREDPGRALLAEVV